MQWWLTTVYRRQPDRAHLGTNANQIHRTIYINRCNYKYEYIYKWYKYQTLIQMQKNPFYQLPNSQSYLNIVQLALLLSVSFLVWPSSHFPHILESSFGFHCVSSCANKDMQQSELDGAGLSPRREIWHAIPWDSLKEKFRIDLRSAVREDIPKKWCCSFGFCPNEGGEGPSRICCHIFISAFLVNKRRPTKKVFCL